MHFLALLTNWKSSSPFTAQHGVSWDRSALIQQDISPLGRCQQWKWAKNTGCTQLGEQSEVQIQAILIFGQLCIWVLDFRSVTFWCNFLVLNTRVLFGASPTASARWALLPTAAIWAHGAVHKRRSIIKRIQDTDCCSCIRETSDSSRRVTRFQNFGWEFSVCRGEGSGRHR